MFRITEDLSSGSLVQCWAKNYSNGSMVYEGSAFIHSELHTHTAGHNMLP